MNSALFMNQTARKSTASQLRSYQSNAGQFELQSEASWQKTFVFTWVVACKSWSMPDKNAWYHNLGHSERVTYPTQATRLLYWSYQIAKMISHLNSFFTSSITRKLSARSNNGVFTIASFPWQTFVGIWIGRRIWQN